MVEDESELRGLLTRSAPSFEPLDGAALRSAAGDRARPRRVRRVVLPLAVAAVVAAVAVTVVALRDPRPSASDHREVIGSAGATPTARSSVNDQPSGFRIELVLPASSFPADGEAIEAYALVTNDTGQPITISNACNGWIQAGLTGKNITFVATDGLVACPGDTVPVGTTRIAMRIPTTFTRCQQGRRPGTPDSPHCLGATDSELPNLPAGNYVAEVGTLGSTSVLPALSAPVPITLTPSE